MKSTKPIILTFTGNYIPGFRGGGPVRTIASLVEALGDEFVFKIITLDRDLGCRGPYAGVKANDWQKVGKAEVFYFSPEKINLISLRHIISSTPHDILYLNSFFSPKFTIIPMILRRFRLVPKTTTIIAPRGEFSTGALKLKSFKKRVYLNLVKSMNLYQDLIWHVSSAHEKENVCKIFKTSQGSISQMTTVIAPNLPNVKPFESEKATKHKIPGSLKIVFLSRISPMKNLYGALKMLKGLRGQITFNIFGPLEDKAYWAKCQKLLAELPANIQVHYQGVVDHDEVVSVMASHDLFFLPTLGENFGHVIIEALAAGCPILISDQTPWRNLEKDGIGWDLPLERPERFTQILQQCSDMEKHELASYSNRAREYARRKTMDTNAVKQNRDLFLNAI